MKAGLALCAFLVVTGVLLDGRAEARVETGARKPRPKRKPTPTARPRKKSPVSTEAQEAALHQDRLAIIGRIKDVNGELKDAELAAILERIKQKEATRHTLARQLIKKEQEGDDGK